MIPRQPWSKVAGLYVVEFPHAVKGGKAHGLRNRLRNHVRDGATRIHVWVAPAGLGLPGLILAERGLLHALEQHGQRIGATESFTGLPFETAVAAARRQLARWPEPAGAEVAPASVMELMPA